MNCWSDVFPEASQTIRAIAIATGCPQELDDKMLLLKTSHNFTAGHREINLRLNRKFLPY